VLLYPSAEMEKHMQYNRRDSIFRQALSGIGEAAR
jgi:hypothetical protein